MKLFRKDTEETKLTDNNTGGSGKKNESRKEIEMKEETVTHLTADVEIKGTIKFGNILQIDGKFEGEMITDGGDVIVGKTGSIKANIHVKNAFIEGHVDGNIVASEKVELKEGAQLIGDLKARTLAIEEGVVFVGKCNVNPDGFKMENANSKEGKKGEGEDPKRY